MSSHTRARWLLILVLLVAAGLRLYGLNNLSPPGPAHDEVANWLIDRSILAGQHAIYFTEAYGHEAGFHYLQAGFVALIGDNALALRLPAAFAGLLGVAVSYALAKTLFNRRVALITAALLGVLFWPVFYSRLGLRAISLPLVSGLSAYFWWRAWQTSYQLPVISNQKKPAHANTPSPPHPHTPTPLHWLLAGLFAGLSLHTYMAARVVPIFYALFTVYLALFHRQGLRRRWRGVLLFWLALAVVAAPLVFYLLRNPAAEFRIGEIDAPLRALWQGDIHMVVDNFVKIVGMFGYRGDPLWRQNVAPRPVFDPVLAAFFYLCLFLCLARARDSRYAFLLFWVLTAFIPSIVTIDAPSSIRISNILPFLTLLPAILMHSLGELSTENTWLSTTFVKKVAIPALVLLLLVFHGVRTARAIFITWPANDEVQFVWQQALTEAAGRLDSLPSPAGPVAIGGWTPDTMDPPTMALTLRREDLTLRFFDPRGALIIPAGATTDHPARILHPTALPLAPPLAAILDAWAVPFTQEDGVTQYAIRNTPPISPQNTLPATFGDEIEFLGYDVAAGCHAGTLAPCHLVTYWRVLAPPAGARRIERRLFLHVVDNSVDSGETLVTTGDALDAPAGYWQPGDLILQQHTLAVDVIAPYQLRLGVYDPTTGRRLLTNTGADHVSLSQDGVK